MKRPVQRQQRFRWASRGCQPSGFTRSHPQCSNKRKQPAADGENSQSTDSVDNDCQLAFSCRKIGMWFSRVEMMAAVAREVVGAECVVRLELPSLGGEDFALYQQQVPGAMARLGTGNGPMTERHPLHSGLFDIEEAALLVGSRLLTRTALHSVL